MSELLGDLLLKQILIAISIVVGFAGVAWLSRFLLTKVIKKYTQKTKNKLDNAVLKALTKPLVVIVCLLGLYFAAISLPQDVAFWGYATKVVAILLSLVSLFLGLSLINTVLKWYKQNVYLNKKDVGISLRLSNFCWIVLIVLAAWLVVIIVLSIWGLNVSSATGWLNEVGWRIALIIGLAMVIIIGIGEIVPRVVVKTLSRRPDEKASEVQKRSDTLSKVMVSTFQIFVFLIAVFMILSALTIDIAPILASAGVVGIAIGFGAQSLVKDIVAGLFIIIESQYRVGDVVKLVDVAGTVESINLRRTVLRDIDGIVHTIPNGEIRVASNLTKDLSRVNLNISVGYGENLERVIGVINKLGNALAEDPAWAPSITKAPQVLRVDKFGDSGIDIKITGETLPSKQWEVTGELRLRLKKVFDEENIEIPWPHTKMYFGDSTLRIENVKPKGQGQA